MKNVHYLKALGTVLLMGLSACDNSVDDVLPASFKVIQLNPDVIYVYNGGSPIGSRLDPLLNDSIKVDVTVSYSTPANGTISFITNEGWFYKPNSDFFGEDNFTYTACSGSNCQTAPIKMVVEQPLNPDNCVSELNGESVETKKDQPIEIRVFLNDIVCPFSGLSLNSPVKGTFKTYSYSGNYKSIVYVYFPPKGFTGTDQFKYKIFTSDGDLEATCTITITE